MGLLDAIDGIDAGEQTRWDWVIKAQHHHRIAPHDAPTHLHRGDIHVVLAEQGAEVANDARHVPVAGKQHVPAGGHIEGEFIDAGNTQFPIGKHRTGNRVAALGIAAGGIL